MSASSLFFLIFCNVLGGASVPIAAWTLETWHPATIAFWRALGTGLLLAPFAARALRRGPIAREDWWRMWGVGTLGFAVPILMGSFGLMHATATEAALLTTAEPICIVFMSAPLLGEKLTARSLSALAAGALGATLIILQGFPGVGDIRPAHWRGDVLLFAQGFFWALYTIIGKPSLKRLDPMSFTAITSILALPALALAACLAPRAAGAAAPYFVGVVMAFVGPLTWNYAMEVVPAATLANFVFIQPLVGVSLSVLLRHDAFTAWSAAGGALILAGVYACAG